MDAPPYVEEDRPPTVRAPQAPPVVAPARPFSTPFARISIVIAASVIGGLLGLAFPLILHR